MRITISILCAILAISLVSCHVYNGKDCKEIAPEALARSGSEDIIKTGKRFTECWPWKTYDIMIDKNTGVCFIVKTSKKMNLQYRKYLDDDISKEICLELGINFKGKHKPHVIYNN